MKAFDFQKIEKKWQKQWEKEKIFEAHAGKGKKGYVLEMYPYPSASGLHIGHAFNYVIGDIFARYKRMHGCKVLHPMGFDSFGLPAENAAIKEGIHPQTYTDTAIKHFIKQQKSVGLSYDWARMLCSHDPAYYRWNQYFFLQFLKKGLMYRKQSSVNWCSDCNTVLANEQVHQGKCWRHTDTAVVVKNLEQWFIRITAYADELLREIDKLDWPERIKAMQRNWIGRSEGAEIVFTIAGKPWKIFTTRPDTLMGVTFLVVSAHHPDLMRLVSKEQKKKVEDFVKKLRGTKQEDLEKLEKEGVFTGAYAEHPISKEKLPVWAGNFVLAEYGSGMVMAVPAHDQRDFAFAQKYKIPIREVVGSEAKSARKKSMQEAYTGAGVLVNSGAFDGLFSGEAKEHIVKALEEKHVGLKKVQYKLRDWLVSRQRYWGTPIPIVYCATCGAVPVPEKELPVLLPEKVTFGKGNPLETNKSFLEAKCPKCGKKGRRETDTLDTFFDSSWYYLRFTDTKNIKLPFDKQKASYWMPVDFYTGGAEHACMHLIYARFFTKALRDLGFLSIGEPFKRLFNQGMIHGEDGFVMSKSRGNVVDPMEVAQEYGADTLRFFLMSLSAPDTDSIWSATGIEGSKRFLSKLTSTLLRLKKGTSSAKAAHKVHTSIQAISEEIEYTNYNNALIHIRELMEVLAQETELGKSEYDAVIKLLAPFCPHVAEELWERAGNKGFVSLAAWPQADTSKIDDALDKAEEAVEKTISDILNVLKIVKEKGKEGGKVYLYVIPHELKNYDSELLGKRIGKQVAVFAVNNKQKYDPEGKAAKAKPGKPGIYVA